MRPEVISERRFVSAGGSARASRIAWPSRGAAVLAAACGFVAIGCAAAPADASPGAGEVATVNVQEFERWTDPDLSIEAIDTLRRDAHAGDADAAVAVVSRLVGRYERDGSSDDLFEATVWIDRYHGNEAFAQSGLIARLQQRDCRHKVLQLHWLCNVAE